MSHLFHTPIPQLTSASDATLRSAFGEIDKGITRELDQGASLPVTASPGDSFWRTDVKQLYRYDSTAWQNIAANPIRAAWSNDNMYVSVGNAFAVTFTTSQRFCYYASQAPGALGDVLLYSINIYPPVGHFVLYSLGIMDAECGIVTLSYKHASDTSFSIMPYGVRDWYRATPLYNYVYNAYMVLTKAGRYTIKFEITGKNASSSGYNHKNTRHWIQRGGYADV